MHLKKVVMPQLKGCTIQHVNNGKVQPCTVKYPSATPYGSKTRSYTDAEPSKASARHCVEWVWQQHRKANPSEECPWNFGDPFGGIADWSCPTAK